MVRQLLERLLAAQLEIRSIAESAGPQLPMAKQALESEETDES
jgi:hypothetical protein